MTYRRTSLARPALPLLAGALLLAATAPAGAQAPDPGSGPDLAAAQAFEPGREVAVRRHLADGEELLVPAHELFEHGALLFRAMWTGQEGGGRPLTKGTGGALADPDSPLEFPRNFNRVSAPDANSCAGCHVPALPLTEWGEIYYEPNPFNPPGNLRPGDVELLKVDLNSGAFPPPRLRDDASGITWVPAFTDFKLHDITSGPDDPNRESLNMHFPASDPRFFEGNSRFLTKRLWGTGNTQPYFHHGKYTTLREAILAHAGEAQAVTDAFRALPEYEQGSIVEFLKTLQVLPEGTEALVVDQDGRPRSWPPPWAR